MIIESSPTNLDPRVGLDAQSERIDDLIFDDLLTRDAHLNVAPGPGRTLGHSRSADLHLPSASRREVSRRPPADRPRCEVDFRFPAARKDSQHQVEPSTDSWITSMHATTTPSSSTSRNPSPRCCGISPMARSASCPTAAATKSAASPSAQGLSVSSAPSRTKKLCSPATTTTGARRRICASVRFIVVPDTTTRALELRKGSADIAINALTSDMVLTLERDPNLAVLHAPGTVLAYHGIQSARSHSQR